MQAEAVCSCCLSSEPAAEKEQPLLCLMQTSCGAPQRGGSLDGPRRTAPRPPACPQDPPYLGQEAPDPEEDSEQY